MANVTRATQALDSAGVRYRLARYDYAPGDDRVCEGEEGREEKRPQAQAQDPHK